MFRIALISLLFVCLFFCDDASRTGDAAHPEGAGHTTKWVAAAGGLRIRERPDLAGERLATVPNGAEVKVLENSGPAATIDGRAGRWNKIAWGEVTGYVFDAYLSSQPLNESVSEADRKFRRALSALAGVEIPDLSPRKIQGAEPFDPGSLRVQKRLESARHVVVSIAPTAEDCDGYGHATCFTVIYSRSPAPKFVYADIATESIGSVRHISDDCATFEVMFGEGDLCSAGGGGTTRAFLFDRGDFIVKQWEQNETCPCACEETGCRCAMKKERSEKFTRGGKAYTPTPAELKCFSDEVE